MGDNEEHLCFMLFLGSYVQKWERRVLRSIFNETYEEIFREFFSDILKEDLVRNWELLDLI